MRALLVTLAMLCATSLPGCGGPRVSMGALTWSAADSTGTLCATATFPRRNRHRPDCSYYRERGEVACLAALDAAAQALVREAHTRLGDPCARGEPVPACADTLLVKGGASATYAYGVSADSTVTVCIRVTPAAFGVIHRCEVDACGSR